MNEAHILSILYQHPNEPISGQSIADKLGISRNAVWKIIEQLRTLGYQIETQHKKGYLLTQSVPSLHASQIQARIEPFLPDLSIQVFEELSSTNDVAKENIIKTQQNQLIIAKKQNQGRGRVGKSFYSELKDGLYFSLAFKPDPANKVLIPLYTLAAATALVQTLEPYVDEAIRIKWVNDIFYKGKKVAGILSEASTHLENGEVAYIIIGIGLNLAGSFQTANTDIQKVAGTIFGEQLPLNFNQNQLLADYLRNFYDFHLNLDQKNFLGIYNQHLLGINQTVYFQERNQTMSSAIIRSVNDQGHLIVEQNGQKRALISNEISLSSQQFAKKDTPHDR